MTKLDVKSIEFLRVVDEFGGRALTSEIRNETGMSNSSVNYRYKKLVDRGLIEINWDDGATPEGVSPMKIAVLTSDAYEEIEKGLLVESNREVETEPTIESLAEDVDEIYGKIDIIGEGINDRILPHARGLEAFVARLMVVLDASDDIDLSMQDLTETEVSDEELAFLRKRIRDSRDD